MTDKQIQAAFDGTKNLFLTGPGGVGKSYWLNKYIDSHENVVVCASTGMAAFNIGGDTVHKVFHVPVPCFESPSFAKGKKGAITTAQLKVIAQADAIIVDEISMCTGGVFRFMIKVLRKAEKIKGKKIRLIVSGDFSQLPPVVQKDDLKYMKKNGLHESGYCFTTAEWKSCNFKVVELTEVKRQSNKEFIEILNNIRLGNIENLDYFKQFVNPNPDYSEYVCICGTNAEADRINQEYLDALPGHTVVLQSYKEGRCGSSFNNDLILIKEGAQVVFTSNDNMHDKYKNGTFGVVKRLEPGNIVVTIGGEDVIVYKHDYSVYTYTGTGGTFNKKEIGVIHQYPFKLGKAITIHKSQGQSFDRVIISPEIFAAGQLYVALSRVRTPEGLVLLKEITKDDLIIDKIVQKFYKNGYKWLEPVKKPAVKKATNTKKTSSKKTVSNKTTKKSTTTKKKPVTKSKTKSNTSVKKSTTTRKKPVTKCKVVAEKSSTTKKRSVSKK